ncbi:MAG: PEP-CTERM sorting domain-containing protein [Bryobacterales bacterium]|nr:PEP-CTERM sorting domain-containing protein [Bryobacteraceae bacterium]MDW8130119.1 PEP-CTERM sorting domain-containing protein [Bryobacterales bacterium]
MKPHGMLALCLLGSLLARADVVVYSQDFEGPGPFPGWSGAGGVATTGGFSAFGFGSRHWHNGTNQPTVLTLTGLGPHTRLTLSFYLALWDSVDIGDDNFRVILDGNDLINTWAIGNYYPPGNTSVGPGVHITGPFTGFYSPDYGRAGFRDAGRQVSNLTVPHTNSTAVFQFWYTNPEWAENESFGIDNVVVTADLRELTAIPEPSGMLLVATGAAMLVWRRLRARRAQA